MERGIQSGSTGLVDRESRLISLRRDDEPRKMDLLFYRGEVPKKPKNRFNTSKSNDRGSKSRYPKAGS